MRGFAPFHVETPAPAAGGEPARGGRSIPVLPAVPFPAARTAKTPGRYPGKYRCTPGGGSLTGGGHLSPPRTGRHHHSPGGDIHRPARLQPTHSPSTPGSPDTEGSMAPRRTEPLSLPPPLTGQHQRAGDQPPGRGHPQRQRREARAAGRQDRPDPPQRAPRHLCQGRHRAELPPPGGVVRGGRYRRPLSPGSPQRAL